MRTETQCRLHVPCVLNTVLLAGLKFLEQVVLVTWLDEEMCFVDT